MDTQSRPGVMLYFDDVVPAIEAMDDGQLGALFRAIIAYARHGEVPELDGMGKFAFAMLRPKIDRDGERYAKQKLHGLYMVYCRQLKLGEKKLTEDEWIRSQLSETDGNCQLATVNYQLPTASASASATTPATAFATASSSPSPLSPSPPEAGAGAGGLQRGERSSGSLPQASNGSATLLDMMDYERIRQSWKR